MTALFSIQAWRKNIFQPWSLETAPEVGSGTDPLQGCRNVMLELPLGGGGITFSEQLYEVSLLIFHS